MSATNSVNNPVPSTYATKRNRRFSDKTFHAVSLKERFGTVLNSLPVHEQRVVRARLVSAESEFRRNYPNLTKWSDIELCDAKEAKLSDVYIDITMQRRLNLHWVSQLLGKFRMISVMPISVYLDATTGKFMAWDGQHTVMLLWYIATQIFGEDPENVTIPVVIYKNAHKSDMRFNFVVLNGGEAKMALDDIDKIEQEIFGVRVDGNTNPKWKETEQKQCSLEKYDLFITHEKFGDEKEVNAISRAEEFKKMRVTSFDWLCNYLSFATKGSQPVEPKELVMMEHYFTRCLIDNIKVDDVYIADLATTIDNLWDCDFEPEGKFWTKAKTAYYEWHYKMNIDKDARFTKHTLHGFPFLIAQLKKSFKHPTPFNDSSSEFYPLTTSLD